MHRISISRGAIYIYVITAFLIVVLTGCQEIEPEEQPPNIVIIYADDMGYGDLNIQNSNSKILTPFLDKFASEGIRFTDVHSSSGICSPSRFSLLTGVYHWRRQHDIVKSFGEPFFEDTDIILPHLLRDQGYTTACIGKWHLGWEWDFKGPQTGKGKQWGRDISFYSFEDINWDAPIRGGPLDRGFDYYFGDGTINLPPYAWIENDRFLEIPNSNIDVNNIGHETKEGAWEFRAGPKVSPWNPYEVLPILLDKTVSWVEKQSKDKPFFLYFSLPSPHAPIIPNDEFDGKSEAGAYGDFIVQTDWIIGQVLEAINKNGFEENTLIIFSSDNGPEIYAWDRALKYDHFSMGEFRGLKRDLWEGGHHVPMLVKWPKKIKAGRISNSLISQTDIFKTIASAVNLIIPEGAAQDSHDFFGELLDSTTTDKPREFTIHNTGKEKWGVRKNNWLYINNSSGEHSKMQKDYISLKGYKPFNSEVLLFNLEEDIGQFNNLSDKHPDIVTELDNLLQQELNKGYYKTNREIQSQ